MPRPLPRIRYNLANSNLRRPLVWFRHRDLGPADIVIGSYPRSGSTWLRFLLSEILTGQPATFETTNQSIPGLGNCGKGTPLLTGKGRLIQTHELYRRAYTRAVYLVRDPRDVVLSEFARDRQFGFISCDLDEYLARFLRGKVNGVGPWQRHVLSWLDSPLPKDGNLLLVRFEEMRTNTESVLAGILNFLGVGIERERILKAIANNSLERMRAKEDRALVLHKSDTEDGRFVRRGAIGGWRAKLTGAQAHLFVQSAEDAMARVGYAISKQEITAEVIGA
jgi:Sulfotransferase domain